MGSVNFTWLNSRLTNYQNDLDRAEQEVLRLRLVVMDIEATVKALGIDEPARHNGAVGNGHEFHNAIGVRTLARRPTNENKSFRQAWGKS